MTNSPANPLNDDLLNQLPGEDTLPEGHKSGFVAVIGRPNVGKSTLMNAILGEKIAIVSPKPQTTRIRQLGILTRDDVQIVFVDTPGIHDPQTALGEFMVQVAVDALRDADVILFVVDTSHPPTSADRRIAELIHEAEDVTPVLLVLNKVDLAESPESLQANTDAHRALVPNAAWMTTIAREHEGTGAVLDHLIARLPEGPRYYPADQLSDTAVRDIVAEIVREKALINLEQEVPHGIATQVEEFKQRSKDMTYINCTIFVERDSHKGILIGKQGRMLKTISQQARQEIEQFLDTRVYLDLWVKVLKNWRRDELALKRLGYRLPK
ncbi:MAG: GTPase Era [Anaerolineae bacterium]|nr:GTPase Era [Anaerolineae bacterium]